MSYAEARLETFLEEQPAELFLRGLLPRILPAGWEVDVNIFLRPHEGKSDLAKSLPRKVKSFVSYPQPVRLLVLHDQD